MLKMELSGTACPLQDAGCLHLRVVSRKRSSGLNRQQQLDFLLIGWSFWFGVSQIMLLLQVQKVVCQAEVGS